MVSSRRSFLLQSLAVSAVAATDGPPNVVLVITDDQGYGDLSCHGNPVVKTPNLDELHSRSVRFTNYHVSPTCAPTRASLLTGRYANATGVWHTIMGRSLLRQGEVTLADCFAASGYRTGIFGKWHLGDNYPCRPSDRGFQEVLTHGGGGIWQTPDYFGNDYFDDTYNHNGKYEKFKGFCTDVWFDNAMKFMGESKQQNKPFFAYVATNAPHGPMWAPEGDEAAYKGKQGNAGFYGMIGNVDQNMGRLMKYLREQGLEENTILIFTTDNGSAAGAQVHNLGMRGAKGSPYDGGHRVPFFLHWPKGGLTGGKDISTLAAHVDVLPTLRDLCNLKRPKGPELHGMSWKPLLEGRTDEWPDRTVVTDSQRVDNLIKWRQTAVMTQNYRLVYPTLTGDPTKPELYDMRSDPGQTNNIAADNREIVDQMAHEYNRWWQMTSRSSGDYVRIIVGDPAENPVRLTAHDWHGPDAEKVWNQRGIREAAIANGFWAIDVRKVGRYRIELRRWPREVDLPIGAGLNDKEPNRETTPGKPAPAIRARVKVDSVDRTVDVAPSDKAAIFDVNLVKGPASMQTWFYSASGVERGAYYVYVEKI